MNSIKKMMMKRAVKRKIETVVGRIDRAASELGRELRRLEKRVPVKVTLK